jgi:hypothetical protein
MATKKRVPRKQPSSTVVLLDMPAPPQQFTAHSAQADEVVQTHVPRKSRDAT